MYIEREPGVASRTIRVRDLKRDLLVHLDGRVHFVPPRLDPALQIFRLLEAQPVEEPDRLRGPLSGVAVDNYQPRGVELVDPPREPHGCINTPLGSKVMFETNTRPPKPSLASIESAAYLGNGRGTVRFELWRPSIEKQSGLNLQKDRLYEVMGDVDGKYEFVAKHRVGDNKSLIIHAAKQFTNDLIRVTRHVVNIRSIEEKINFEVASRPEPVVTISKRSLESAGIIFECKSQSRLIEFEMRNLSRKESLPERCFGTYFDSQKSVRLYVGQWQAKAGDRYMMIRADDHTLGCFATEFNSHPAKETQNVKLNVDGGELEMQVDGKKFQPIECKLTTYHLQVGLRVKFHEGRGVRLWFDGQRIRLVYDSKFRIHGFQASDAGLRMLYESKSGQVSSKYLSSNGMKGPEHPRLDRETMMAKLVLTSAPQSIEGMRHFEADPILCQSIVDLLRLATANGTYRSEKGRLGENLVSIILAQEGWTVVRMHPFAKSERADGSYIQGPDCLVQDKSSRYFLLECKWPKEFDGSFQGALGQLSTTYSEVRVKEKIKEPISGVLIGLLDWEPYMTHGSLDLRIGRKSR
jgi:hypothetical protein